MFGKKLFPLCHTTNYIVEKKVQLMVRTENKDHSRAQRVTGVLDFLLTRCALLNPTPSALALQNIAPFIIYMVLLWLNFEVFDQSTSTLNVTVLNNCFELPLFSIFFSDL